MIGQQPTGTIPGIVISAVSHECLRVSVDGKPGRLAVVLDDGTIVAAGDEVAREARSVAINCYRAFLKGEGFLRVMSKPIKPSTT